MRRDKKAAKKKKERAKASARRASASLESRSFSALVRAAHEGDFGPAFMSPEWRDDELPPHLVTVVITRKLPHGNFAFHSMLVDRTCLGVKNAFTHAPLSRRELDGFLEQVGRHSGGPMEEVDVATAQAVVLHALAFAEALGFEPNPDFDPQMLEPYPDPLADTPLAHPDEPFYVPGPDDDVDAILEHLEEEVGPGGFEFGHPNDDDDDDDDDDDEGAVERAEDEQKLFLAIQTWLRELQEEKNDPRLDLTSALAQYVRAATGKAADGPLDPELMSSLPLFWAGLFRPLRGRTGLELARESKTMTEHRTELERVARTRAVLFDVLDIDVDGGTALGRDVFSGASIKVRLEEEMLFKLTRWMRMFGYVTPMDDDTWYPPSALLGHPWLRNSDPADVIARTNTLLAELGIDERIDPKSPDQGLLRYGALFHGVLHRSIAPSAEERAEREAKLYIVNSDDEPFELHEATITLARPAAAKLSKEAFGDEEVTVEPLGEGMFRITASSVSRFDRLLSRISELAGSRVEPENVEVMRPWERLPNATATEVPGARKVIMSVKGVKPDATGDLLLDHVRTSIREDVPMLGGRPIDLVKEPAGRERVERWLADQELRGAPGEGAAFLDLDDVRRELGLPTAV